MKVKRYRAVTKKDERGFLTNIPTDIMKDSKHAFFATMKPGSIRGNHIHRKKTEWITTLNGRVTVYTIDPRTAQRQKCVINDKKIESLEIKPGVAVAIKNESKKDSMILVITDKVFKKTDTDSYFFRVI